MSGNDSEITDSPDVSVRRGIRNRKTPNRFGEFASLSIIKETPAISDSSEEEEKSTVDTFQTSKALFSSDDVEGQEMFQFKSSHTYHDLQNKAKTSICSSPIMNSPKTPKRRLNALNSPLRKVCEQTPKSVKDLIKKRIIKEVDGDSEGSDFSGSSSDFVPEGESDSNSQSEASDDEVVPMETKQKGKIQISQTKSSKQKTKDSDYIVTPDNYFMMNSSKKIATSDHTLARLKNLNLDTNIEENIQISEEHKKKITNLTQSYQQLFNKWLYVLGEKFNIILYGIGSKKSVLQEFQKQYLNDFPCIVVNGFFPSLTIKSILETIVVDLLGNTRVPANISDAVSLIDGQLKENGVDLFLIIHNIDGATLRNAKSQSVLANISQIQNVHTIATIDHINAPLLWDHSKLSKFNFTWWDVTTFLPYLEETSFENSMLSSRSGALQMSSLRSVYQSLTSNAKGIFNIIINYQLENNKQQHYQGLPFKDLYSKCREEFLVSSDIALRAQLTEFLDHKLVKMKRSYDGSENLVIPIENVLLQQFLDQIRS